MHAAAALAGSSLHACGTIPAAGACSPALALRRPRSVRRSCPCPPAQRARVIGACYFAAAIAGFSVFGNAVTGNVLQSIPT